MVAVAPNRIAGISLPRLRKIRVEAFLRAWLSDRPRIKKFVHHEEAHPVAEIQKLRRGGVVRRANGVHAELSQPLQSTLPNREGHRDADGTTILMECDAFEFKVFPVEPKPGCGLEACLAH